MQRSEIIDTLSSSAYDVMDSLSIDDLIAVSDVCIADYSSLFFEYALMDRPIVFYANDLDDYYGGDVFLLDTFILFPGR